MPADMARITDLGPIPGGIEYALCCLPCEIGWARSEGMTCWACGRLGHLGVLPVGVVTVKAEAARAESRAIEAACNTYERVDRPKSA